MLSIPRKQSAWFTSMWANASEPSDHYGNEKSLMNNLDLN